MVGRGAVARGVVVAMRGAVRRGYSAGRHRCKFRDRSGCRGQGRGRCMCSSRRSRGELHLPCVVVQMAAVVVVDMVLMLLLPVQSAAGNRDFPSSVVEPGVVGCGRCWGMERCCMDREWEADPDIVGRWHFLVARRRVVVVVAAWEMDTSL